MLRLNVALNRAGNSDLSQALSDDKAVQLANLTEKTKKINNRYEKNSKIIPLLYA